MSERFQKIAEQVVSTTSFITEPLPTLKVSDQKVDHDAMLSGFRLSRTDDHNLRWLIPEIHFADTIIIPERETNSVGVGGKVFFAPISKKRAL